MIVKMTQNLGNRIEKIKKTVKKDIQEEKNKQTVINNKITEIKNTLEGINRRITKAEEWISELEDRMVEITAMEQDKQNRMGASLVAQWLGACLPMRGTQVRALVWEDPTCCGAAGPVSHNC